MRQAADFERLLEVLCSHGVEFVVVGGVGAVLQGAPITTFDLDVVHQRSDRNVTRLLGALASINAKFRSHPHVSPAHEHFSAARHNLMMTDLGPLDLLGAIGDGVDYSELLPQSEEMRVGELAIKVMTLPAMIAHKQTLSREKDKWALSILIRTLEERDLE